MTLVLLTGATRGIGQAAAIGLARQGAEWRSSGASRAASMRSPGRPGPPATATVHEHVADLQLMQEVRALASEAADRYGHIDVLANNAGALFASRKETSEGLERTFALNHLAPFLLTNLLRPQPLRRARRHDGLGRPHRGGKLDLDDLQSEHSYAAMRVYGTSKLCNILFTRELARRAPELHANCFHPGVVRTGFGKNENGIWKVLTTLGAPFMRSPEKGASTLLWLATSEAGGRSTASTW